MYNPKSVCSMFSPFWTVCTLHKLLVDMSIFLFFRFVSLEKKRSSVAKKEMNYWFIIRSHTQLIPARLCLFRTVSQVTHWNWAPKTGEEWRESEVLSVWVSECVCEWVCVWVSECASECVCEWVCVCVWMWVYKGPGGQDGRESR